ncbi:MAG: SAM-dependent methyltransferase, partial [Thermodesulfobacteriota bacterium]
MLVGYAISLISAGVIGYEILLMRLLSVIQWYHFAYMIISLALLGFGASGTFIALAQRWLLPRFHLSFTVSALLFGFTTVGNFILAQQIAFNPLEMLWNRSQLLYLLVLYVLLSVPFFCAATCIGLTFARFKDQINRMYRFDLLGAGTGALAIILLLFVFPPATCLKLLGALGFFAAALMNLNHALPRSRWLVVAFFSCGLILPLTWPDVWLSLRISDYKGLSLALRVPGATVLSQHSSPLGLLTVVRSPTIPFRHAPGLSLNYFVEPPPQLGIFTDGDSLSPITRYEGKREPLAYLDYLSSALPYHLLEQPKVLVLGAGGGTDVLMALYHHAKSIDAVELNPQMIDLVERVHAEFAGNLYQREDVKVHAAEARGFVAGSTERYDLIHI